LITLLNLWGLQLFDWLGHLTTVWKIILIFWLIYYGTDQFLDWRADLEILDLAQILTFLSLQVIIKRNQGDFVQGKHAVN